MPATVPPVASAGAAALPPPPPPPQPARTIMAPASALKYETTALFFMKPPLGDTANDQLIYLSMEGCHTGHRGSGDSALIQGIGHAHALAGGAGERSDDLARSVGGARRRQRGCAAGRPGANVQIAAACLEILPLLDRNRSPAGGPGLIVNAEVHPGVHGQSGEIRHQRRCVQGSNVAEVVRRMGTAGIRVVKSSSKRQHGGAVHYWPLDVLPVLRAPVGCSRSEEHTSEL